MIKTKLILIALTILGLIISGCGASEELTEENPTTSSSGSIE